MSAALVLLGLVALAAALTAARPSSRFAAAVAALASLGFVLACAYSATAWETHFRRGVYLVARASGLAMDRAVALGLAACSLGLALAPLVARRASPAWLVRALALGVVGMACGALAIGAWLAATGVAAAATRLAL